jgi:hypothetical protein
MVKHNVVMEDRHKLAYMYIAESGIMECFGKAIHDVHHVP